MLSRKRFTEIVGENVRKAREKAGKTQDSLSAECGFYRTAINLIETAKRSPTAYTLFRIASSLHIPVDELYPKTV